MLLEGLFNVLAHRTTTESRGEMLFEMLWNEKYNESKALSCIRNGFYIQDDARRAFILTSCAGKGYTSAVRALLDTKVIDVNARDQFDDCALLNAVRGDNTEIVRLLHDRGARGDVTREGWKSIFYFASHNANEEMAELVADLYPKDKKAFEQKALHQASAVTRPATAPKLY